jgi:SAM-dependent methyltransferase
VSAYDRDRVAEFFDEYGEQEWTRFETGRTPRPSLDVHFEHLRRFVRAGDRVLDVGAGPGRFTIELARLGADVVVADVSPAQLELNREHVAAAGCEERVLERVAADVLDLGRFEDGSFDAAVCFGGPLSYVVERAPQAVAELARVVRAGGHVLVSVMSLVGAVVHYAALLTDLVRRDGSAPNLRIVETGILPEAPGYGHLAMKLYRPGELVDLLSPHGEVVALSAAGLLPHVPAPEPEVQDFLRDVELLLASDPGAVAGGEHILAVLRR